MPVPIISSDMTAKPDEILIVNLFVFIYDIEIVTFFSFHIKKVLYEER
jgi:hypothetical protein